MHRKNLALEAALIICALVVAFVVQEISSHSKPPKMPEFAGHGESSENATSNEGKSSSEPQEEKEILKIPDAFDPHLSLLGEAPDWSLLDQYQCCVSREEFIHLISSVYSVGEYWKKWFTITDEHVLIRTHAANPELSYKLVFKTPVLEGKQERYWRSKEQLDLEGKALPLTGLKVAIDPGHIGGNSAELEERRFVLTEGTPPIQEGNMTLSVAEMLVDQLEALGASVSLVRDTNEPVNPFRPEAYFAYAKDRLQKTNGVITEETLRRSAQKLFYRNGEIRARSLLVNDDLKPDVVLCVHFNASGQADPEKPVLVDQEHFHMILNGAYTEGEMANDDERFKLVFKIVQGVHAEELALARAAAEALAKETGLPPYQYAPNSNRAVNVGANPYLWARNLLANRLYDCPVLFFEPYLMNGKDSYARMQMGDFDGLRYVNGQLKPAIFREYVRGITKGLVTYYTQKAPEPEEVKTVEEEVQEETEPVDETPELRNLFLR